jgi:hypothetical protein
VEENPRDLARLLKEIDDGLSEFHCELREILEEVQSLIRTNQHRSNQLQFVRRSS